MGSGISLGDTPGVKYTISETTYFVCTIPGHCAGGQKLEATITTDEPLVSTDIDWTAGFRSEDARKTTIDAGTELIFNWSTTWQGREVEHDVVMLPTKEAFDACDFSSGISLGDAPGVKYTISETTYFVCTIPGHCVGGQKLEAMITSDALQDTFNMKVEGDAGNASAFVKDVDVEEVDRKEDNLENQIEDDVESSATAKSFVCMIATACAVLVVTL